MFPTIKLIKTYSYEDRKILYSPSHNPNSLNNKYNKHKNNNELLLDKDSFKKTTHDPYAYPN